MSRFLLEIDTPDRPFFNGEAEAVTIVTDRGELTVLANHAPMIAVLKIGYIKIRNDGKWRTAFCSQGYLEVHKNKVIIFSQACEWPEEIDMDRVERARQRALQKLEAMSDDAKKIRYTLQSLARAEERIRVKNKNK